MQKLDLHDVHAALGARFTDLNGAEVVSDYGDSISEQTSLYQTVGVIDLSFRSRICLTGSDRMRFLHGQVTNDVKSLQPGQGCYAALVTAKGRMQSDLNIYCLVNELLLDFEPGLTSMVSGRLEKYIVSDDVQLVDVAPHYGLLSIQGPQSAAAIDHLGLFEELPSAPHSFCTLTDTTLGELYLAKQSRLETDGFDLYVPISGLAAAAQRVVSAAKAVGGCACGWNALEMARIEAGIPRFGLDIDEGNLPQECGIESHAVSYNKGCYIGQEVLNRIHTMGHVNRMWCGFKLAESLNSLPQKGDKLWLEGREAGYVTSALMSRRMGYPLALGYVRRELKHLGTELTLRTAGTESKAWVTELPFRPA
jgi:folate-binding protein YgfZ